MDNEELMIDQNILEDKTEINDEHKQIATADDKLSVMAIVPLEPTLLATTAFSVPFIENQTGDTTGPTDNSLNYCNEPTFVGSHFRLGDDSGGEVQIVQFFMTIDGSLRRAYCLERGVVGPLNNEIYQSAAPSTVLASLSFQQRAAVAWMLANTYPATTGAATFALAGVSDPTLADYDAYIAVQFCIWIISGGMTLAQSTLYDCANPTVVHPKNAAIQAVIAGLLNRAYAYAQQALTPSPTVTATPPCGLFSAPTCPVQCCGIEGSPTDPALPYITLTQCPYEVRFVCGRALVGPFMIQSNLTGTPVISTAASCVCDDRFSTSFTDYCGNAITTPGIGQEFYLAILSGSSSFCLNLSLSITGSVTELEYLEYVATTPRLQNLGTSRLNVTNTVTSNFSFSINTSLALQLAEQQLAEQQNGSSIFQHSHSGAYCQAGTRSRTDMDSNININNVIPQIMGLNLLGLGAGAPSYPPYPPMPTPSPCPNYPPYPPYPYPPYPCPPGTYYVPGQGCVPGGGVNCPPGTYYVPGQGCVPGGGVNCPPGTYYVPGQGCVPGGGVNCPPGTHYEPGQGCVPNGGGDCPPGTHYVPGQGCVPGGGVNCPPGTHYVPGQGCVPGGGVNCPPGTHYVPGQGCVPGGGVNCPPGTHYVPGQGCVPGGGVNCPPGTHYVPGQGCVPGGGVNCPPGTHYVPCQGCVTNGGEICPPQIQPEPCHRCDDSCMTCKRPCHPPNRSGNSSNNCRKSNINN